MVNSWLNLIFFNPNLLETQGKKILFVFFLFFLTNYIIIVRGKSWSSVLRRRKKKKKRPVCQNKTKPSLAILDFYFDRLLDSRTAVTTVTLLRLFSSSPPSLSSLVDGRALTPIVNFLYFNKKKEKSDFMYLHALRPYVLSSVCLSTV